MIVSHRLRGLAVLFGCGVVALAGCRLPGKPGPNSVMPRPDQITDFHMLYQQNCQACHGVDGRNGTAISLANPVYIAYAGQQHIAEITANGIDGSLMPGFAIDHGGQLTGQQIQALAQGMVQQWGRPAVMAAATPPAYESQATGNAAAGEVLYRANCIRCHAPGSGSVLDPTYLALISDSGLRTWLVTGQPEQGMPDWRGYAGGALSDQQLADLVSFLANHRVAVSGQPSTHPAASSTPPVATENHQPTKRTAQ